MSATASSQPTSEKESLLKSSYRKTSSSSSIMMDQAPLVLIQDPAPDGGYGWVIVTSAFMLNCIGDGVGYSFGLFFDHLLGHFSGSSASQVALANSLMNACCLGAGPIVSSFINNYGCRAVVISGAIIWSISLYLSTLVPSIHLFMLTYGVLGGIGFSMLYLPSIVSVGYYFTTKRAFATGVAVCGTGVGTFLFAPACQLLLNVTSWQNAQMILAVIVLSAALFGALMRPLGVQAETRKFSNHQHKNDDHHPTHSDAKTTDECHSPREDSPEITKSIVRFKDKPTIIESIPLPSRPSSLAIAFRDDTAHFYIDKSLIYPAHSSITPTTAVTYATKASDPDVSLADGQNIISTNKASIHVSFSNTKSFRRRPKRSSTKTRRHFIRIQPLARPDIFYSGSINRHPRLASHLPPRHAAISVRYLAKRIQNPKQDRIKSFRCRLGLLFQKMMHSSLLGEDVRFSVFVAGNLLSFLGFYIPYVYVTQFAVASLKYSADLDDFISKDTATLLISTIGASNIVGRLAFGLLGDRLVQNRKLFGCDATVLMLNNLCVISAGVAIVLLSFCVTIHQALLCCAGFGFFIAGYICLTSIVLVEMLGLDRLTSALGVLFLFRGLSSLLGTPLAGAAFDETQSYPMIFTAAGGLLILSGILTSLIRLPPYHRDEYEILEQ